jgi:hypothetical protein
MPTIRMLLTSAVMHIPVYRKNLLIRSNLSCLSKKLVDPIKSEIFN